MTTRLFLQSPSEAPDAPIIVGRMPEFERYGERALLLARPGDVVCVAHAVDGAYLDFLQTLELGPRREDIVVVDGVRPGTGLSARVLRDPSAMERVVRRLEGRSIVVSPFFPTADAFALGRALQERLPGEVRVEGGSAELARRLHDKIAARELAESLGIPVAPGEIVAMPPAAEGRSLDATPLREAVARWADVTGHAIVRGASGASGSSVFTTRPGGVDAMIEQIAERTDNSRYLVEPLYEARFSPNVEVVVDPDSSEPLLAGATEQVLDPNLVYVGSAYPCRALRVPQMIEQATAVVAWMRARGFTGRVGLDFVEHAVGSRSEHFLTEINPRVNGASYPLALLRRLSALAGQRRTAAPAAFRTGYERVPTREYGELAQRSRGLLFDPARGEGIVPYSVGALPFGKVGIAYLGREPAALDALRHEFLRVAGPLPGRAAPADAA